MRIDGIESRLTVKFVHEIKYKNQDLCEKQVLGITFDFHFLTVSFVTTTSLFPHLFTPAFFPKFPYLIADATK